MSEEQRNYGMEPEPEDSGSGGSGVGTTSSTVAMSPSDENTWSILSHVSIFLNLFTGFLGPVAALVIWLVYKDRSPRVSFHALQSLWYQVAWLVILSVGWTVTFVLMAILIGFLLVPVMAILTLVPFIHAGYAAYKVNQGEDYRYLWIADMVSGEHKAGM
ncbi:hypothetical protein BH23ACT11_BH23ACT11_21890 [soil metagenome]